MASDIADLILIKSKQLDETDNVSYIRLYIENTTTYFKIIKSKNYIKILDLDKEENSFKIVYNETFNDNIKQLWFYIIQDKLYLHFKKTDKQTFSTRHVGISWHKTKDSKFSLFEAIDEPITSIMITPNILNFINFICTPHISIES